jgi:hypothetical protein
MRFRGALTYLALLGLAGVLLRAQGVTQTPALAPTQDAKDLAKSEAQQRHAEWMMLAVDLEKRIARLLPCDPRISTAVDEVSRASSLRLDAVKRYWQAAAQSEANRARDPLLVGPQRVQQANARAVESAKDHADADEMKDALIPRLGQPNAEATLAPLAKALQHTEELAQRREATSQELAQSIQTEGKGIPGLAAAIQNHRAALEVETLAWQKYYAARQERAHTECAVTNAPVSPTTPAGKK